MKMIKIQQTLFLCLPFEWKNNRLNLHSKKGSIIPRPKIMFVIMKKVPIEICRS